MISGNPENCFIKVHVVLMMVTAYVSVKTNKILLENYHQIFLLSRALLSHHLELRGFSNILLAKGAYCFDMLFCFVFVSYSRNWFI